MYARVISFAFLLVTLFSVSTTTLAQDVDPLTQTEMDNASVISLSTRSGLPGVEPAASPRVRNRDVYRLAECDAANANAPCYFGLSAWVSEYSSADGTPESYYPTSYPLTRYTNTAFKGTYHCKAAIYNYFGTELAKMVNVSKFKFYKAAGGVPRLPAHVISGYTYADSFMHYWIQTSPITPIPGWRVKVAKGG